MDLIQKDFEILVNTALQVLDDNSELVFDLSNCPIVLSYILIYKLADGRRKLIYKILLKSGRKNSRFLDGNTIMDPTDEDIKKFLFVAASSIINNKIDQRLMEKIEILRKSENFKYVVDHKFPERVFSYNEDFFHQEIPKLAKTLLIAFLTIGISNCYYLNKLNKLDENIKKMAIKYMSDPL